MTREEAGKLRIADEPIIHKFDLMVPFAGHGQHADLALHVALCLQVGQQVDRLGLRAQTRRCAIAVAHVVRVVAAGGKSGAVGA